MDYGDIHHLLEDPCYGVLDDHDDGYMEALRLMGDDDAHDGLHAVIPEVGPTMDVPLVQDTMVVGHEMSHLEGIQEDLMEGRSITDLLLKGAEAVEAKNWQLASTVVTRLDHLLLFNQENENGPLHRLAFYFTEGLRCKILTSRPTEFQFPESIHRRTDNDTITAYRMLHELSPYVKFAHFTANQAILEATIGEQHVHVIDFDVMEGIQWPPLMEDLALRKDASLRITAVSSRHNVGPTQQTGRRLKEFADSIGLPFSFDQVTMQRDEDLQGIKLSPKMVVLVEEELFDFFKMPSMSFVEFFCEGLQHYTAFSDSLMNGSFWSGDKVGHRLIEEFLGLRILDCLRQFPLDKDEREIWGNGFSSIKGFKAIPMSGCNVSQAKILVGLFGGGYWVQHEKCRLALCWKSRPLTIASIWVPT
ncbi:protein NODULATION SIGNALING PATHWAY 2-like [Magnolia sinica]|uniref:protein NODULATION SIGNALING PATHWAY 2-like n=1 Tax=Magnolia sinica TaxID=86752 RepID=UPI00265B0F9B|nr:protein NODULATION SIGNALING PATHWAY 2-like [Magnolia sinica]